MLFDIRQADPVARWNARAWFCYEIGFALDGGGGYPRSVQEAVRCWWRELREIASLHREAVAVLPPPGVVHPEDAPRSLVEAVGAWQARWRLGGQWLGHVALSTLVAWAQGRLHPRRLFLVPGDDLTGAACPLSPVPLPPTRWRKVAGQDKVMPSFPGWRGSVPAVRGFAQHIPGLQKRLPRLLRAAAEIGLPTQAERSELARHLQVFIAVRIGGLLPEMAAEHYGYGGEDHGARAVKRVVADVGRLLGIPPARPRGRPPKLGTTR